MIEEAARILMKTIYQCVKTLWLTRIVSSGEYYFKSTCSLWLFWMKDCFSKSSQQLLQLIKSGLKEITTTENINNLELFHTMRNIISLYCDLMPLKHDILLKSIPQQAGNFKINLKYSSVLNLGVKNSLIISFALQLYFSITVCTWHMNWQL